MVLSVASDQKMAACVALDDTDNHNNNNNIYL